MVTVSYKPTTRNQGATGQAPFPKCFKNMFSCSVQRQKPVAAPVSRDMLFFNTLLLLQPLRWCCVDCVIHERDVRDEQKYIYVYCIE